MSRTGTVRKGGTVPDERMNAILERAARDGRDQMLVSSFDSNRPDRIAWPDR